MSRSFEGIAHKIQGSSKSSLSPIGNPYEQRLRDRASKMAADDDLARRYREGNRDGDRFEKPLANSFARVIPYSRSDGPSRKRDSMMLASKRDLLEAEQLQDLWCSLSLRHVSLEGGRCSCGRQHVTLRLTDFEEDIGEYLYDDAARAQRQDINAFLRAYGRDAETGLWNIDRLLRLLASAEPELGLTPDIRAALVAKLRPIIESFDRLHI